MTVVERKDIHNSEVPVLCRSCEMRHKGVCGRLSPEQLTYLARHASQRAFERDVELFRADAENETCSNLMGGVVKLVKLMADGRRQIVGLQFAPDFVGRPFASEWNVSAETATQVRVCSFPRHVLELLAGDSPELEHALHEQALRERDEAHEWMLLLGRKSASERVASFLYALALQFDPERVGTGESLRFELPLKRSDMADFLGLTIETVSRQLRRLQDANLIRFESSRAVVVPDPERLREACEEGTE